MVSARLPAALGLGLPARRFAAQVDEPVTIFPYHAAFLPSGVRACRPRGRLLLLLFLLVYISCCVLIPRAIRVMNRFTSYSFLVTTMMRLAILSLLSDVSRVSLLRANS